MNPGVGLDHPGFCPLSVIKITHIILRREHLHGSVMTVWQEKWSALYDMGHAMSAGFYIF